MRFTKTLYSKIHTLQRVIKKKARIQRLAKLQPVANNLSQVWAISSIGEPNVSIDLKKSHVLGCSIDLSNVNWHMDIQSGFSFPKQRFDTIHLDQYFNKGIDVKFPWEVSRFYFAIHLAQAYQSSKEIYYYHIFKTLVLDWIDNNPFLIGVNWVCTMEVAIRASNWIVAMNIFGDVCWEDTSFIHSLSNSLEQHAEYISNFPEVYKKGHSTNHTTADYAGLLFLSIALQEHPKSKKWLQQAVAGLEECIEYQVREDGGHFESSIPYHRLVLELFGYSTLIASHNDVIFSDNYYHKLYSMFQYTAKYIDHNGEAPMVGDNDSGRFLVFRRTREQNHYYLLQLGKQLFGLNFIEDQLNDLQYSHWLPIVKFPPLSIQHQPIPREGFFQNIDSGSYIFRSNKYYVFVSLFPIGMNGQGGHNHIDMGSFVLSMNGKPVIVDPGTYTYTRSLEKRMEYRSPHMHNIMVTPDEFSSSYAEGYWDLQNYPVLKKHHSTSDNLEVSFLNHLNQAKNRFYSFGCDGITIQDFCKSSKITSFLHLADEVVDIEINEGKLIIENTIEITVENATFELTDYDVAIQYDQAKPANKVVLNSINESSIVFEIRILS
ncbi:heparinase II/III family protein [Rapidithrix thailandica]|uniref:Heparinase II/III family protein n=1 Tax=Rapidithrix thailandica TaxID=413964 RepID=A0AAW9S9A7_9BACT